MPLTARRRLTHCCTVLALLLPNLLARGALAEPNALLVHTRQMDELPARQREEAAQQVNTLVARSGPTATSSPLTLEQLALVVGCDARLDACRVQLARQVAHQSLLVPSITIEAGAVRVGLSSASAVTGSVTQITDGAETTIAAAPAASSAALPAAELPWSDAATRAPAREGPSQAARIVGTAALSSGAVLVAFGIAQAVRARRSASDYERADLSTAAGVDQAEMWSDDAHRHARAARGVLTGAAVLGTTGVLALLWHKLVRTHDDRAGTPALSAQVSRHGLVLAFGGSWRSSP